ncbi:hypothetical protein OTU49_006773 [Cherax quadricarinatus]|uniref:methionyl-tRNA formyltransferase n=2 Tax=Cherax quadricarinatus TaxID=27406 RepID=A0AAW0X0B7_CHEQU|nr:methionyl-tRNA formyltransferase, mitochondrial-like isoform X1 [Cherax quadricarinatus]
MKWQLKFQSILKFKLWKDWKFYHFTKNLSDNYRRQERIEEKSKPPWDIMFFGTDEFSLKSLTALHREQQRSGLVGRLDVVSIPSKKTVFAVRQYCQKEGLPIQDWPVVVPHGIYDVGVVASFGRLIPAAVIQAFPLGILNIHGSLLPRWRGAGPVVHAVLNNDSKTGITIMKIEPHRFDVGKMVSKVEVPISWDTRSGALSKYLADVGAQEMIAVLQNLTVKLRDAIPQTEDGVTKAPKISEASSKIDWNCCTCHKIQSMYRAFDDYFPLWTLWHGAPVKLRDMVMHKEWSHHHFSEMQVEEQITEGEAQGSECIKENAIENCEKSATDYDFAGDQNDIRKNCTVSRKNHPPGRVIFNKKMKVVSVLCRDGWVSFKSVIIKGRKPMSALDFYNGFITKIPKDQHKFD